MLGVLLCHSLPIPLKQSLSLSPPPSSEIAGTCAAIPRFYMAVEDSDSGPRAYSVNALTRQAICSVPNFTSFQKMIFQHQ